ncbi:DNA polymerase III subunit delta' [Sulfurovum sp. bin170]|uniref:DNA polymerase III subunit delta' n=1 Tax=Sulfurovum sp. bin170 TaxID=2695268 RepID=UPI0013DF2F6B|nr:DNA polymerase III subunit delta' [Sulfurovum sp. bin170]NEW61193.1 DNA polymerase III subunit delta' [Sulfurovum sp. bin170]
MRLASGVIITGKPDEVLASLEQLRRDEIFTIIKSEDEKGNPKEFLVVHAKETIAKAYIASDKLNYIILIAPSFSDVVQNRLLKILEEPPKNKAFIIITESKSAILDTVKSRMPITVLHDSKSEEIFTLDIENLNLAKVYESVQENSRLSSVECKKMVEKISLLAMKSGKYRLDEATLKVFSDSIKALDMGSPTSFILNTVLLKLLARKRR